jgi:hypothetical protein
MVLTYVKRLSRTTSRSVVGIIRSMEKESSGLIVNGRYDLLACSIVPQFIDILFRYKTVEWASYDATKYSYIM